MAGIGALNKAATILPETVLTCPSSVFVGKPEQLAFLGRIVMIGVRHYDYILNYRTKDSSRPVLLFISIIGPYFFQMLS